MKLFHFFLYLWGGKCDLLFVMKTEVTTTITREILDPAQDWECVGEEEIDIVANYYSGTPERGPSYDCGGTPEEPPFVEIVSAFIKKEEVELTAEEEERVIQYFLENPPTRDDYEE